MDEQTPLQQGIDAADGPEKSKEYADVAAWMGKIKRARKFDEAARVQYAKDRRYARGDSGFEVDANIIGTNIDILESFLYAKDPDVDAMPAVAARPPSIEALRDAGEELFANDPSIQQMGLQTAQQAVLSGLPQDQAMQAAKMAEDGTRQSLIDEFVTSTRKRYAKRQRDNKAFAETIEIIVSRMWKDGQLKKRGRPWVRSALTVGVGALKASWQQRTAPSPETITAINDLQTNIKQLKALKAELDESDPTLFQRIAEGVKGFIGTSNEAKLAEYERQLAVLQAKPEQVTARGFVVDRIAAEDFQVAPGYTIADHADAPWNAHRIPMLLSDARAEFGLSKERAGEAKQYTARKPVMVQSSSAMLATEASATDADAYTTDQLNTGGDEQDVFCMLWEIWDRDSGTVLTGIEGVKCWVKPAWTPPAATRFYPFFALTTSEVDGQRHPQSLVSRTAKLVDEYNRIGSAEAEHRRRIRPKTIFNKGRIKPADVKKIEQAVTQEMVGIEPIDPAQPLGDLLTQVTYAAIDGALYDRQRITTEIDRIWGVQEALSGSIQNDITATEAEIQHGGFQARTSSRRDQVDSGLGELAYYTAEVSREFLTDEDARAIAGPDAFWPAYEGPGDLARWVTVDIRAGSSGKPNTTAERQAWATQLPMLEKSITAIGQLRQSTPADIADCLEGLLRITAERSGDRIDIDQLVPQAGPAPVATAAVPGIAGAPAPSVPGAATPAAEPAPDLGAPAANSLPA